MVRTALLLARPRPAVMAVPGGLSVLAVLAVLAGLVVLAACGDASDDPPLNIPPAGATTGGDGTTFNHDNNAINIWDFVDRLNKEGPVTFSSRMHSCFKVRYTTLGNVLTSVGVDLTRTASSSAAVLYREGMAALGAPDYPNRIRENRAITTAGAARTFDIFLAASDEIIAALPTLPRCRAGGMPAQLFDADDHCMIDGITCLIGVPAQQAHVDQCNLAIIHASSPAIGKRLAVALLMAAAYTCE
jgi:hypothetical protein